MTRFLILITLFLALSSSAQQKVMSITDKVISISGGKLEMNAEGFPKQIQFYNNRDLNTFSAQLTDLLYEPVHFHYYSTPKTQIKFIPSGFKLVASSKDRIIWNALNVADELKQEVSGEMFANGVIRYKIRLKALKDVTLNTLNFHIPFQKSTAKYLAGLNQVAGLRPDTVKWDWAGSATAAPAVWIGDETQGLYLSLNDQKIFNHANLKNGWISEGKGKLQINIKGSSMLVEFSTGNIELKEGAELAFDYNLIISEPANLKSRFNPAKKFKAYRKLDIKTR